jgi:hypothetical protein
MNVADILMSTAAVILSVAVLVMAFKGFKKLEANVGQVKIVAEAVNKAVNNVGPTEPTLRSMVQSIGTRLDLHISETDVRLGRIENEIVKKRPTRKKDTA